MKESLEKAWAQRPLIISGPCSAETEEQVVQTAIRLKATQRVDLLRAGIWKPRTKPGMFEGIGEKALPWLIRAGQESGLPVMVEVARAEHVELALRYAVDVLWIGARSTVNPFSVQELADALKGVHIPVFIKNPVNPDLELWSGAVERVQQAGITHIGLIHRGFTSYAQTHYRNAPMWQLPIEMKRRFPHLKMICDPSHICGNRELLVQVAQKSIDLDFDGLMIESHIDPDHAWSDARQQVTPEKFLDILNALVWRSGEASQPGPQNALMALRGQIDHLDDEIMDLLSRRMKLADQIGQYKKAHNMTILQAKRWNDIMQRALSQGIPNGLSREFIIRFLDAVHLESIQHQNRVMNEETPTKPMA